MASYDDGEVTDREKLAAKRQKKLAVSNAKSTVNQLNGQLKSYDLADRQNKNLADLEKEQNRRKAEADRFQAARDLRNAVGSIFGAMGTGGMQSSTIGDTMTMTRDRNDADNMTYWNQLQENLNSVNNARQESLNQNQVARYDARVNAAKSLSDIQSDLAANLSNINPNLYEKPGSNKEISKMQKANNARLNGGKILTSDGAGQKTAKSARASDYRNFKYYDGIKPLDPKLSGYVMPSVAEQAVASKRNKMRGGDYFGQLINGFNGR